MVFPTNAHLSDEYYLNLTFLGNLLPEPMPKVSIIGWNSILNIVYVTNSVFIKTKKYHEKFK